VPSLRRLLLPAAALIALALPAPALAACDHGDAAATSPEGRVATLCLINAERTERGLGALTVSAPLGAAAQDYAKDMVTRGFFDHVSPGGGTMMDRIKAAGWVPSGTWTAGENIAWGSGSLATPVSIVAGWMASPGHRANILNAGYGQIGLGIADGAPQSGVSGPAATYVTDFASGAAPAHGADADAAHTPAAKSRCARAASRHTTKRARRAALKRCGAPRR
jgi:uncharacterized protein YkwD